MCPFCIANAAILAAAATSTGGLTAFVAAKFSKRVRAKNNPNAPSKRAQARAAYDAQSFLSRYSFLSRDSGRGRSL